MGAATLKEEAGSPTNTSPAVAKDHIFFRLADPDGRCDGVRLCQEINRPRRGPRFETNGAASWELRWPRPRVGRFEYAFEVTYKDGSSETICDPSNPLTAPGPFGDKSVAELPGYRLPAWLDGDAEPGLLRSMTLRSRVLHRSLGVMLWSAPGVSESEPRPLLVAHDGPELARYSSLIKFLEHLQAKGMLPPMRAALLAPVDRGESYSASTVYARALAHELLPALNELAPVPEGRSMRVGLGASLGALAMLHAHRLHPASFGALFLQSGSYFRSRFDQQESGFPRFVRICRFVGRVVAASEWVHTVPISMTCGSVEENLANNRLMATALTRQGYEVALNEHPDAHNWVAWRDTFDPYLVELLSTAWR